MKIEVSIIIVCMNNLDNLCPCLNSIKKYTTVTYETLVVAYLFSDENIQQLKKNYPWITVIESNEIRGFSENNNLALKQAKGEFSFILNDDTFFNTDVVGYLLNSFYKIEDAIIISPDIRYPDGTYQICGRRRYDWLYWIIANFELKNIIYSKSKYENRVGIFQTYNISGAAFMIKTKIFKELGFFDEIYFFSPEDIALSTKINEMDLKCYVNENIKLYHIANSTASKIKMATIPSHEMGALLFFSKNRTVLKIFLSLLVFFLRLLKAILFMLFSIVNKKYLTLANANVNTCKIIFSNKTPKEIFLKFYKN